MKNMNISALCLTLTFTFFGMMPSAFAQHQGHGAHSDHNAKAQAMAPSTKAFNQANATMHKDMSIPFSGNADHDFVRGMIPHHQGAIDMAKIVLQYGKTAEAKSLATAIIKAQDVEIAEMKSWLLNNPTPVSSPDAAAIKAAYAAVNDQMHKDMMIKFTDNADLDFLSGMIPHHEAAVAMAKILKQHGKDTALLRLADNIIQSQNTEISLMRKLLSDPHFAKH
jgi:uncharacterized protein (DUF305 family)